MYRAEHLQKVSLEREKTFLELLGLQGQNIEQKRSQHLFRWRYIYLIVFRSQSLWRVKQNPNDLYKKSKEQTRNVIFLIRRRSCSSPRCLRSLALVLSIIKQNTTKHNKTPISDKQINV